MIILSEFAQWLWESPLGCKLSNCHIRHINTNECHYYTSICVYKTTKQQNSKDWRQHMNRHTKPEQKK